VIRGALLCLFLAAVPISHAMYKWVDEKGVTHYSETAPPDGKAQKIELKPSAPAEGSAVPAGTWKQRDLESRQRRIEKDQE